MAKKKKSVRYNTFNVLLTILCCGIMLRLFDIQVLHRNRHLEKAKSTDLKVFTLEPERGKIYDRNGSLLAFNVPGVTVVANVDSITDIHAVAARLSPILETSYEDLVNKIRGKKGWVELAKKKDPEIKYRIENMNLQAVGFRQDLRRRYPKGKVAGQVVGFTRSDGTGGYGLEMTKDAVLLGKPGIAIMQPTGRARLFSHPHYPIRHAVHGDHLVLTLDYRYQRIAQQELQRTIAEYRAKGGSVVIMDPLNGDVLAVCSEPGFDPNDFQHYDDRAWKLAAITDQFEPGSTFKPAMLAAMIDDGYITPEHRVFCENGRWEVMGEVISDTKEYGELSAREVLIYSSNIGMAKLAKDFSKTTMYDYAARFGFGSKSGIELLGEISGTLKKPRDWVRFSQLVFAFGHEIAVTPLQMCSMYATIANGGYYTAPRIIKTVIHDGQSLIPDGSGKGHTVISTNTAQILQKIMADVVKEGTGIAAAIDSLNVCGKTGTARVVKRDGQGYARGRYISSFGGFFPYEHPQVVIYIMIQEPNGAYYGGTVAAPCFRRIAKRIVRLEGLDYFQTPTINNEYVLDETRIRVPTLIGLSKRNAVKLLRKANINFLVYGDGERIVAQEPAPGELVSANDNVYLTVKSSIPDSVITVPSVTDLPLRNAMNLLSEYNLKPVFQGYGAVVEQNPNAGVQVRPGHIISLRCKSSL